MPKSTAAKGTATLSAQVIRADGTVEDLGVIARSDISDEDMARIVAYNEAIEALGPPVDPRPDHEIAAAAEAAHAANEAHSTENEAHNQAQIEQAAE